MQVLAADPVVQADAAAPAELVELDELLAAADGGAGAAGCPHGAGRVAPPLDSVREAR